PYTHLLYSFYLPLNSFPTRRSSDLFGPFDRHIYNGKRLSASHAYLDPAKHRANLDIETLAFVTKINFEGNKATGVTYRRGKHYKTVTAEKIVLAGGAINTPQLLQ